MELALKELNEAKAIVEDEYTKYKRRQIFSTELFWLVKYFDDAKIDYLFQDMTFIFFHIRDNEMKVIKDIKKNKFLSINFNIEFEGDKSIFYMKLERRI